MLAVLESSLANIQKEKAECKFFTFWRDTGGRRKTCSSGGYGYIRFGRSHPKRIPCINA